MRPGPDTLRCVENNGPGDSQKSQTEEIAQSAREKMAEIDRDFEGKLADLGDRVKTARGRAKQFEPEANNIAGMNPEEARGMGYGFTVGYAVIGMPIAMYVVGLAVDRFAKPIPGGMTWAGLLAMVGGCLGIGFAIFATAKQNR